MFFFLLSEGTTASFDIRLDRVFSTTSSDKPVDEIILSFLLQLYFSVDKVINTICSCSEKECSSFIHSRSFLYFIWFLPSSEYSQESLLWLLDLQFQNHHRRQLSTLLVFHLQYPTLHLQFSLLGILKIEA